MYGEGLGCARSSGDGRAAASHYSALALMNLPIYGASLSTTHVVRASRRRTTLAHGQDDARRAMKYEGAQGRESLVPEKTREDLLRQRGYGIVRLIWSDLADPARVQAKMLAEIAILRQRRLW